MLEIQEAQESINYDNFKEIGLTEIESDYPILLNKLLKFIIKSKEVDKETTIMDLLMEYSMRNAIELDLIGDAISTDEYFKNIVQKDLEMNNYLTEKKENYDW